MERVQCFEEAKSQLLRADQLEAGGVFSDGAQARRPGLHQYG